GEGVIDIPHDRQMAESRDCFAQQLKLLGAEISQLVRQASDIASRSRKAGDEAGADRVSCHEDDRNNRRRLLCRQDRWRSRSDYAIDFEATELGGNPGEPLAASFRPAILDRDAATLDPPKFSQPLDKSIGPSPLQRSRSRAGMRTTSAWPRRLRPLSLAW